MKNKNLRILLHVSHFYSKITKIVFVGIYYDFSIKLLKALSTMQSNVGNFIAVANSNTMKRLCRYSLITGLGLQLSYVEFKDIFHPSQIFIKVYA